MSTMRLILQIHSCMVVLLLAFYSSNTMCSSDLAPADTSYLEGNKAYKEGRIQTAIECYKVAIGLNPDHYYGTESYLMTDLMILEPINF